MRTAMLEAEEPTSALGWTRYDILNSRHHDLSTGPQVRQIDIRDILLQQPDCQLIVEF